MSNIDYTKKQQIKQVLEKVLDRKISDLELDKFIRLYLEYKPKYTYSYLESAIDGAFGTKTFKEKIEKTGIVEKNKSEEIKKIVNFDSKEQKSLLSTIQSILDDVINGK